MAFPFITPNHLSGKKQLALLILALGAWAFIIYIRWMATPDALLFIGAKQLDKLAHLAGGIFIALAIEWRLGRMPLTVFAMAMLAATIGWEAMEFFFDTDTRFFYANAPDLWRLDASGDVVAAFRGGYGYWVFGTGRLGQKKNQRPLVADSWRKL